MMMWRIYIYVFYQLTIENIQGDFILTGTPQKVLSASRKVNSDNF